MRITPNPYSWDRVNLKLFYGRHQLATDIIADLNRSHSNAVVGGRKMGKTTLLRKIENDLISAVKPSLAALVLQSLAPDEKVKSQPDYTPDRGADGKSLMKPTRKQRINFIMRNKGLHEAGERGVDTEISLLETLTEQLARVVRSSYEHASARTHTLATHDQAWQCLKQLDSILAQIL